jgi:hypothetical protein
MTKIETAVRFQYLVNIDTQDDLDEGNTLAIRPMRKD